MRRWWVAAALLLASAALHAQSVVDDSGRRVVLPAAPQRIVTLAPSLTELVFAVGAGSQLVATVDGSDHPRTALQVPRIGDYQRVDVERIVGLKPDLVLVWSSGNTMRELAQLEAAGLRLFHLEPRRLDAVPAALERVGTLLGHADDGRRAAQQMRDALAALRAANADLPPVRVFYQVWSRPLLTINDEQIISDVMRLCGGHNVFGALAPLVPEVSTESVVAANPEAILSARETGPEAADPGPRRAAREPAFAAWAPLRSITAVRRGWIYTLPGDTISRQGPRIVEGARAMCAALAEVRRERAVNDRSSR